MHEGGKQMESKMQYYMRVFKGASYNDGNVSAGMYVGGIVGKNQSKAVIESCYNAGTVSGIAADANCALGGIAGDSTAATINKCYNVGTCTPHADSTSTKLGLLVGVCVNPAELNENYFLGSKQAEGYGEFTNNAEPAEAMMKAVDAAWLKSETTEKSTASAHMRNS